MAEVCIAADLSVQYFSVNMKPTKPAILQINLLPAQQTQHKDNICGVVPFNAMLVVQAFSILYKGKLKFPASFVPSSLHALLNTCVLLHTLKEAEWGHITPSHASYRRSLQGILNSYGE